MTTLIRTLAAVTVAIMLVPSAFAQNPGRGHATSPFVPTPNEPAPKLFVDAPLPGPLARGAVLIPYRMENFLAPPSDAAGRVTTVTSPAAARAAARRS
jgi:hypothetical protein